MHRSHRVVAGAVIWILIAVLGSWWMLRDASEWKPPRVVRDVWKFATQPQAEQAWESADALAVQIRDPVFVRDQDGFRQVGQITAVQDRRGRVLLYGGTGSLSEHHVLRYYEAPDSLEWVLQTMLPAEKQQAIQEELTRAFEAHQEEILAALQPIAEAALRDALAVVEEDLPVAIRRHEADFKQLGGRYQKEILERKLVPLVRKEIWPIVQRRAQPLANDIGREMWDRASLWRFGWRYAYDVSPLPEKRLVEKEWQRFLQADAMPILHRRSPQIVRLQQQIVAEVARNPAVQMAVRDTFHQVVDDPQVQRLFVQVVREVVTDNPRMHAALQSHWQSDEARKALQMAGRRMEPSVRRIGELLIGTPRGGITPEFARVLRHQVLRKDRRWLVLEADPDLSAGTTLRIVPGGASKDSPFVQLAGDQTSPTAASPQSDSADAVGQFAKRD